MPSAFPIWEYLNAIYRYRLIVLCTALVGLVLTVTTVRKLPNIYTSTTLIMVEPQDVPSEYVKATVTDKLENRLKAMNQEVLSRTRLEGIINDFQLFPEMRERKAPMERMVEVMRGKLKVDVFANDNAFRISFEDRDPGTVQRVTARLAGLYIDENLRIREEHAAGTAEFLDGELAKSKKQLEDQEASIQQYKQKHMGELPEQRDSNMHALEGYRVQLQTTSTALSAAMERKVILDRQASETRSVRSQQAATTAAGQTITGSPSARLRQLEAELSDLRTRYTEQHPDVVQTQSQIERLRKEVAESPSDPTGTTIDPLLPPELAQAIAQTNGEIKRLQLEEERMRTAIDVYQKRVENAFVREQELKDLSRDYDVTQVKYQHLLDKKLEAQLSQSLERRQKAERFRILDPANLPQAPTKPNRKLLFGAGALLSLGLGLGIPILMRQTDTSFRQAEEFTAAALPVLAVIPQLETPDVNRRLWRYRFSVVAASAAVLVGGLATQPLYMNLFY
jgi:polysaccharide chain length determinant protein (PEP-CTERM system associated)